MKPPPSLTLAHHELRYGKSSRVPRHLNHELTEPVAKAIEAADKGRRYIPIGGTKFELYADLRQQEDGNALCIIVAGATSDGGKVKPGTTLYLGVVGTRLSTSVTAWRHVIRDYVAAMVSSPQGITYSSFGAMPRDMPWAIGFMSRDATALTPEDYDTVVTIARLAGIRLAELCEKATLEAERAGKEFAPDFESYPELR